MSNIAFITTRKHLKSYNMISLLNKINDKRFGGKLNITEVDGGWKIKHPDPENWDYIWYHPDGVKTISAKHPHDRWMCYAFLIFNQEIGAATKGMLSDEGVDGHWKPNPKKYPNWNEWLRIRFSHIKDEERRQYCVNCENYFLPKGMENY